ncbi:MAG: InlB B-repeat-containing protein [Bacteroidaceae bacterium]|nr:InlB B-repeat-containing protein [Bacteroidaceae bacterium]
MKQILQNKFWLRICMLVAILCSAFTGTARAETVTYSVTSTSSVTTSGTAPQNSSASYASTASNKYQITKNNSATLTLSGYEGYKITNITLNMASNKSAGAGTLSYSTDGGSSYTYIVGSSSSGVSFNESLWNGSWVNYNDGNSVDISKNVEITATSSDLKIVIAGTTNSLYCLSYKLTYESTGGDTPTPTTYTVTYNANGGIGNDIEEEYAEGEDVTVASCSFTRTGYAFTKWNTLADGTGTDYQESATIENISADIELFAQWEESNEVVDILNHDFAGISSSSYTAWSGKEGTSGAVYAGQSAGGDSNSGDCVQLRSNNSNSGIVTTTSGGMVTKVVVSWNSQTATGRTLNVYGKNTAYSAATDLYNSSTQGTLLGTIVKGTSTELTINGDYEYIGMRSASGAMYLDEIRITWEPASAPTTVATPVIEGTDNFYLSTNVTITCATDGAAIQYSTDGGNTWNNYTNAFSINETTTVKAKATKTGLDDSNVAEATFTKATVMTVAEAIAAIDENTTVSGAYVSGIVSQVDEFNSSYSSITYWISDDGTTTTQLEVYSGKGLNGEDFSDINGVQVGDVVVVCGDLMKYSDIYEFKYNSKIVSLTTKADPELAFATTEYTAAPGADFTAPTLTNPHNLTVTYSSDDENLAIVDENTGEVLVGDEEGTVTITASFAGNETYRAGSASYTITIVDNTKGTLDNPYTVADVIAGKVTRTGVYVIGYIVGEFNSKTQNPRTSDFTTDANIALADEFTTSPTAALSIPVALPTDALKTAWGCKTNEGSKIGVKVIVCGNGETYFSVNGIKSTTSVTGIESVTVSSAGYATYASDNALDFTNSSIKAFYATESAGTLTFHAITKVPAGTGVLLYAAGGATEDVPVLSGDADDVTGNVFVRGEGTAVSYSETNQNYILFNGDDGIGFYKAINNKVATNRAYIHVTDGNGVKGFAINLEDDATSIETIDHSPLTIDHSIYNIAGQRISKMQKGINIVNGKKVLK